MRIEICEDKISLGKAAGAHAARALRSILQERRRTRLIAATGASQFEFLDALTAAPCIDWTIVEMFHLDEYDGLPITHPASFWKYLMEQLISKTKFGTTIFSMAKKIRTNPLVKSAKNRAQRQLTLCLWETSITMV